MSSSFGKLSRFSGFLRWISSLLTRENRFEPTLTASLTSIDTPFTRRFESRSTSRSFQITATSRPGNLPARIPRFAILVRRELRFHRRRTTNESTHRGPRPHSALKMDSGHRHMPGDLAKRRGGASGKCGEWSRFCVARRRRGIFRILGEAASVCAWSPGLRLCLVPTYAGISRAVGSTVWFPLLAAEISNLLVGVARSTTITPCPDRHISTNSVR